MDFALSSSSACSNMTAEYSEKGEQTSERERERERERVTKTRLAAETEKQREARLLRNHSERLRVEIREVLGYKKQVSIIARLAAILHC